jgi:hypothetical protein
MTTTNWTRLFIGALSFTALAAGRADAKTLQVRNLTGDLSIHQSTPWPCDDVRGSVAVSQGRIDIGPAEGVPVAGGQAFVITRASASFVPFETHFSCAGVNDDRRYTELTVSLVNAVRFVGTPAGAGIYAINIPKEDVLIQQASILNGGLDTSFQHPKEPVTGTLDLVNGTLSLRVVGGTKIHVDVLGDYGGTLTATLNGTFDPPNHPPIAVCQNVTRKAGHSCTAKAWPSLVDAGTSDPDGDAFTLALTPPGPFTLGTTPVMLTATDVFGAAASCNAEVTVVDETRPVIGCLSTDPRYLWPPNHRMVRVDVHLHTRDNCGTPDVKLVSVTCSGHCDANDIQEAAIGTDDRSFLLRAEKPHGHHHGHHHPRQYTITYSATDASGNSSTASTVVTVARPPHGHGHGHGHGHHH